MTFRAYLAFLATVTMIGGTPTAAASQRSADARLQEAMNVELVAGEVSRAIVLYRQIIDQHPGDRRTVARALASLGRSFEKTGSADARSTYQRIVRDYADQAEPLRFARERLQVLGAGEADAARPSIGEYSILYPDLPQFRPSDNPQHDFSPDGQQIVLRVTPSGPDSLLGPSIAIATSGGAVIRTLVPAKRQVGRVSPRWSPDGKYIAYVERAFVDSDTSFATLRIIPAAGGESRVLSSIIRPNNAPGTGGLFWTPDSRAVTIANREHVVTIDLDGKEVRKIPFRLPYLGQLTGYSPDGRWLALHQIEAGSEQHERDDVWIMPAEGGRAIQLTRDEGFDGWPAWSADGRSLYFVSERSGSQNVWKIAIDTRTGLPQGDPIRVTSYTDATLLHPKVIEHGKRLAFALLRPSSVLQVASVDTPAVHRPVTRGTHPKLSPDGDSVYFVGEGVQPPGIFASAIEGGTPRRLTSGRPGGHAVPPFSLSPDGSAIAYFVQIGRTNSLYTVATGGGAPRELLRLESREHLVPAWSPDGKQLAYSHGNGLYVLPAAGGESTRVGQLYGWDGWSVQWSPDGAHLAALAWEAPSMPVAVFVVPAAGGEPRRLTPRSETGYKEGLAWHPDSRRLSYMYYGDDDRGDGSRLAFLDGSATALLVDQPRPFWDYVGHWHPAGRDYYFISSAIGSWGLFVHDAVANATRALWLPGSMHPGAAPPAFSRDGRTIIWATTQTPRQLWAITNPR
jgi:Tol biopolymer transport system component